MYVMVKSMCGEVLGTIRKGRGFGCNVGGSWGCDYIFKFCVFHHPPPLSLAFGPCACRRLKSVCSLLHHLLVPLQVKGEALLVTSKPFM